MINKKIGLLCYGLLVGFLFFPQYTEAAEEIDSVPIDSIFKVPQGSNSYVDGNEIVVTDNTLNQIGSIYSTEENKIDLSKDFYAEMYIKIDGSGDGMTFVMHNDQPKTQIFLGLTGQGLAIYASYYELIKHIFYVGPSQLKKSLAIEFDTFYDYGYDRFVSLNSNNGHIAYTNPDSYDGYGFYIDKTVSAVKHNGVQYPSFKIGDGKWRLLTLKWTAWNASNIGNLTYQYEGLEPISASVPKYTFGGTDNVYWGFTGSTTNAKEKASVRFKSLPGFVDYSEIVDFIDVEGNSIQNITQDSEVTVHYVGQHVGGKQNLMEPTYKFTLSPNQEYQQGSFKLNGVAVTPTYVNNELEIPLSKDLSSTDSKVDIQFKVKDSGVTQDTDLTLTAHVKAKNFLSDNDFTYKITYDKEAPTGTGKLTFIDAGDEQALSNATDYCPFLSEYQDNYSAKDKIKVELKAGQDISTLVKTVGPSSFQLTLTDEKGNARDVTVPLFIQNKDVVKSSQYIIYGIDFSVDSKDYPTTDGALRSSILEKTELKLWQYDDVSVTAMNNTQLNLSIDKLPPTSDTAPAGVYEATASYGSGTAKVDKPINVTVVPSIAPVTIQFVDENNQPIVDEITFDSTVAESIDLTQNAQVLEKLKAVKALNYLLDTSPTDEQNLLVVPEGVTRKYTFKGTLFIQSAPNTINFGDQNVSALDKTYVNPEYDQDLIIWDNRQTLGTWKITLKQSQDFSIPDDPSQKLPDVLSYQTAGEEKMISTDAQEVFSSKHQFSGKYDISQETWGPEKQGLRLNVPVGSVKQIGKYETTLTWQIEEAY
ncbi:WxL domain-containing protein [Enterococcus ureilyticus]|uniref:lectin-like domain-containing protein n=1 Tax=Enterococcus ureilyticus TaxID=1131292 RepID=UPI001A920AF1|nr:WxL domain-containing protein [Enterococcus ureilyticus]MBO0447659.1 WxL domain-containing protein [Enterococcus ureilyticus]